jgi:hypothetical protein
MSSGVAAITAFERSISSRYRAKTSAADSPEPVVLVGQRQVLHQAQAVPPRGQHRPPQLIFRQVLQDAEHVAALRVQETQQQAGLSRVVHVPMMPVRAAGGA